MKNIRKKELKNIVKNGKVISNDLNFKVISFDLHFINCKRKKMPVHFVFFKQIKGSVKRKKISRMIKNQLIELRKVTYDSGIIILVKSDPFKIRYDFLNLACKIISKVKK